MILMQVLGLTLDGSEHSPILVLRQAAPPGQDARTLPIWLGLAEAMSLSMELNHVRIRRPLPHELLLTAVAALGGRISGVSLTGLREGTFYARIDVVQGDSVTRLDCRPSDAVLLALRTGVDIMVDESVLGAAAEGRVRPGALDAERRPLDSAEALIREAGRKLLEEAAEMADVPRVSPSLFSETVPASGERTPASENPAPKLESDSTAKAGTESDEEKLAELLRRLEPASRRVM